MTDRQKISKEMEDKLVEGQTALDKLRARLKEAAIARHTELRMG